MRCFTVSLLKGSVSSGLLILGLLSVPSAPKAARQNGISGDSAQMIALGKALFHDQTLSEPAGMACVTCHDPATGFSYPQMGINATYGPVPGIVPGRFGFRKPPTAAYTPFMPEGVPHYVNKLQAYVGGLFYDGRAPSAAQQAKFPFLNPNEMNNLVHDVGSPEMVVSKIENGPSGVPFRQVFGDRVFEQPTAVVYNDMAQAIAAYEKSSEVSPFSSKYDAYLAGKATLSDLELRGLRMVTGSLSGRPGGSIPFRINAHCSECHGIPTQKGNGPDLWTNSCYANLGAPRNERNPFYNMTDPASDPAGYNPLGRNFIDFGLGDFLYPLNGKPSGDLQEGDPLAIDGTFKTPTLRNVDKRPYPGFVKSYMHNGSFKTLEQVVHFYNTRNLTTYPKEVIDFTQPDPYANLKGIPLWPQPEWPSPLTLINPKGLSGKHDGSGGMAAEQIGNMGLDAYDEQCIVAFLKTLTDGYFDPKAQTAHP